MEPSTALSKPRLSSFDSNLSHPLSTVNSENSADFPKLLKLPNEILIYIMSYLDSSSIILFSRSCLRCYSLGYDLSIWKNIDIQVQILSSRFLTKWEQSLILNSRCYGIRCLYLTGTQSCALKFQNLSRFLLSMRSLTKVTLDSFVFDLQNISVFANFPQIQFLKFASVSFSFHFFREFNLSLIFPFLNTLVFYLCPKLSIQSIEFLANHVNLTNLYVDTCYRLSQIDLLKFLRTHRLFNQRCKCFLDGEQIRVNCISIGSDNYS